MIKNGLKLLNLLNSVYSIKDAEFVYKEINKLAGKSKSTASKLSSQDIALITYANSLSDGSTLPIKVLEKFIKTYDINSFINTTHILPFYPWDTDRGFSVINYRKVDSRYGTWDEIKSLSKIENLMFDFVANHISIENPIAQESLIKRHVNIKTKYEDFVIAFTENDKPKDSELKKLARPRPNPVLTPYFINKTDSGYRAILGIPNNKKSFGTGYVWTTFSRAKNKDGTEETRQVDLNFKNPRILVETLKILLFYISKGAKLIRLDAIGYIWKRLGSSSLHEKEAHTILNIINLFLKTTHPEVTTIAEINEQQDKVLEYLGTNKNPESDMVYQFTHFPLAIYSLMAGEISDYKKWYSSTKKFEGKQFITVLGSHDGLGLKPVRGILNEKQIAKLENYLVKKHGALPNFAHLPGGKKIIYEICSTPWNLINPPNSNDPNETQIKRYLVIVALGMLVRGLPAFYINGLIGSTNYNPKDGLDENRTVNREVLDLTMLNKQLTDKSNRMSQVLNEIFKMCKVRKSESAFDPSAPFPIILDTGSDAVFGILLKGKNKKDQIISLINVSSSPQEVCLDKKFVNHEYRELISNSYLLMKNKEILDPYQILWLK